ncbi:hypothetical protein CHS0354_011924 [Potamilus streckersoni]|uniref:Uncharacterized protein n=1 Tax=Potamilus streckersoni TaxID=2493646 RepID=A0AAE0W5M0_9BIVA|nr:hypothetical protein CHS0354_011924 [Potamilus streckersoni]
MPITARKIVLAILHSSLKQSKKTKKNNLLFNALSVSQHLNHQVSGGNQGCDSDFQKDKASMQYGKQYSIA